MRNPDRIDRVLNTIREAWVNYPDWRLGQLLMNAVGPRKPCPEFFSLEDDRLEKLVSRLLDGKIMTNHLFNVVDTATVKGRGLLVVTDKRYEEIPSWESLNVGDKLELRSPDGSTMRTKIQGLELMTHWTPQSPFVFFLSESVKKAEVPTGSEVWISELNNPS